MNIPVPATVEEMHALLTEYKKPPFKPAEAFAIGRWDPEVGALIIHQANIKGGADGTLALVSKFFGVSRERRFVYLGTKELQQIITFFKPLDGDGKIHPNVVAFKKARDEGDGGLVVATFDLEASPQEGAEKQLRSNVFDSKLITPTPDARGLGLNLRTQGV